MLDIIFNRAKHVWNPETRTFTVSELDTPGFSTDYRIINPSTGKAEVFQFKESTGPEFDPNTKWIYVSAAGLRLEVCNDPATTAAAAKAYMQAKMRYA